jgi:hypothetical protein
MFYVLYIYAASSIAYAFWISFMQSTNLRSIWSDGTHSGDERQIRLGVMPEKTIFKCGANSKTELQLEVERALEEKINLRNASREEAKQFYNSIKKEQMYLTKTARANVFIDAETGIEYTMVDGSPVRISDEDEDEDFGTDFLSGKFAEADKKVESGEIKVCNLDDEDCEACGS